MILCSDITYQSPHWSAKFHFSAETGQWVAIAGPSGGGKSTLLNLLIGFLAPRSGSITNEGNELSALPPHARQMSYMSQQSSLLPHLTCQKNLELSLHDQDQEKISIPVRIRAAVDTACVSDTLLARFPSELSGGELARMNLARALLRPSRWILLDEPFAALDADLRLKILTRLKAWQKAQNTGIFMVSHDPADAVLMADRLLFVDSGHVVAEGAPSDLAQQPKSVAMAKLLKTGGVFTDNHKTAFITPQNLFTSVQELKKSSVSLDEQSIAHVSCKNWRNVQISGTQWILDLDSEQYWMLPLDRIFCGDFYFNRNNVTYLS